MYIPRNHYGFDLFDDFFNDSFWSGSQPAQTKKDTGLMRTDILDGGSCYLVDIELPGYSRDEVKAELKDGYLTIAAIRQKKVETQENHTNYVRKERYTGSMKRSFYVGEDVTENDIQAGFKDGLLKIIINRPRPKEVTDERRYIPIL